MRPTLSELGEYDGTALMEFRTRKNIIYRIKGETACTYDIDDTPPFRMNRDALEIAVEIALLLGTQIVGELHITRKQYLDGSIPTGFQRTAIVGIHGSIPIAGKTVRILQLSIEEDSCREVSDLGHNRTYMTDRLGMPLVETVTCPDLLTPDEAAEAGQYLRFLARSTGKVRVGIGAARQDVNVSIAGGTRVEIKGVQRIRWIPELTHNEAFRQKALLTLRERLLDRVPNPDTWTPTARPVHPSYAPRGLTVGEAPESVYAINLPGFGGLLSSFTSPGRCFADELSDRIKVVACIEKPNMITSEDGSGEGSSWSELSAMLEACATDAQLLVWGPIADLPTALEAIEERCRMAFDGVPNETRKALSDGTTVFERVLPGPDRMYPDTDSVPIPIAEDEIERIRGTLPAPVVERTVEMEAWRIPADCRRFVLKRNLFYPLKRLIEDVGLPPVLAGALLGHTLRHACGDSPGEIEWVLDLAREVIARGLHAEILRHLLPQAQLDPSADFETLLQRIGYAPATEEQIQRRVTALCQQFISNGSRNRTDARWRWVMGQVRPYALGNVAMAKVAEMAMKETTS
jgi:glutamyl-tRNA(Gln) amidotransferase subunit E